MNTRHAGQAGEQRAIDYLLNAGYMIRARNYQTRLGELDCIAQAPEGTVVFVEVKSARANSPIHPLYWVTRAKQQKIARMARLYCREHALGSRAVRFDVIALIGNRIEHLKNAFLA